MSKVTGQEFSDIISVQRFQRLRLPVDGDGVGVSHWTVVDQLPRVLWREGGCVEGARGDGSVGDK